MAFMGRHRVGDFLVRAFPCVTLVCGGVRMSDAIDAYLAKSKG